MCACPKDRLGASPLEHWSLTQGAIDCMAHSPSLCQCRGSEDNHCCSKRLQRQSSDCIRAMHSAQFVVFAATRVLYIEPSGRFSCHAQFFVASIVPQKWHGRPTLLAAAKADAAPAGVWLASHCASSVDLRASSDGTPSGRMRKMDGMSSPEIGLWPQHTQCTHSHLDARAQATTQC